MQPGRCAKKKKKEYTALYKVYKVLQYLIKKGLQHRINTRCINYIMSFLKNNNNKKLTLNGEKKITSHASTGIKYSIVHNNCIYMSIRILTIKIHQNIVSSAGANPGPVKLNKDRY